MKNILKEIKNMGLPEVKAGRAQNVREFFEKIVKPQFENKDVIKETHKAIMEYLKNPEPVYISRLYGSDSKRNYNNLRRGFLTVFPNGKRHVFCDNTFAMPFAAMKICGKAYSSQALNDYMNDSTTRFGFGSTKEERELAYYNWSGNGLNINLNIQGWYLAHIVPVGKHYAGHNLKEYFDNPKRKEWSDKNNHVRRPNQDLTFQKEAVLKAHFLRMIHPLNSFLVPKRSLLAYDGKNIGEELELLAIVKEYVKMEFPQEYEELCDLMMKPEDSTCISSPINEIIWSTSPSVIKKEKSKIKHIRTMTINRNQSSNKKEDVDTYDDYAEDRLENTLRSIGKEVFLRLYPLVSSNIDIEATEVAKVYPEYGRYSTTSQQTRLSSTRSILNRGLEREALDNVANSYHLKESLRQEALRLLSEL